MQMKNGAKAESGPTFSSLTQPVQFLPYKKKDDDWAAWNLDWLELEGMEYLKKPIGSRIPDWLRTMSAKRKVREELFNIVMEENE